MTTIKNRQGNAHVRVSPDQFTANTCVSLDGSIRCVHVPTADLLAALDATANADVKHRADAYEAATAAERGEREAVAKAVAIAVERDMWKARAEEAGAIVARVEAVKRKLRPSVEAERLLRRDLNNAINPAFTLPTEVPARIEAKRVHHGYTTILTLFTDGTGDRFWRAEYNGEDWKDAGVMECFTDHRLLGADQ